MEDMKPIMKGALAGLAIGGFTSVVVAINKSVMQTLWWFNCLAVEKVLVMAKSSVEWIKEIEDDEDEGASETNES